MKIIVSRYDIRKRLLSKVYAHRHWKYVVALYKTWLIQIVTSMSKTSEVSFHCLRTVNYRYLSSILTYVLKPFVKVI